MLGAIVVQVLVGGVLVKILVEAGGHVFGGTCGATQTGNVVDWFLLGQVARCHGTRELVKFEFVKLAPGGGRDADCSAWARQDLS